MPLSLLLTTPSVRTNTVFPRTINEWNNLPTNVIESNSLSRASKDTLILFCKLTSIILLLELGDTPVLYRNDDILLTPVSISSLNFYTGKPVYRRIPVYHIIPVHISILVL